MAELSNLLTPIVGEVGIGRLGGFLSGWALKKAVKMVAVIIGVAFLGLQYLAYKGVIAIDYSALQDWATGLVGGADCCRTCSLTSSSTRPSAPPSSGGSTSASRGADGSEQ